MSSTDLHPVRTSRSTAPRQGRADRRLRTSGGLAAVAPALAPDARPLAHA